MFVDHNLRSFFIVLSTILLISCAAEEDDENTQPYGADVYFEVYGATADDRSNAIDNSTFIGNNRSGNVFDITGHERVKIYIPSNSGHVRIDKLVLENNGLSNVFITSESEPVYTSAMQYPAHMNCNLGGTCPQANGWQYDSADGLYIENIAGSPAYLHFRTWVANAGGTIIYETSNSITISLAAPCNNYIEDYDNQGGYLIGYTCTN